MKRPKEDTIPIPRDVAQRFDAREGLTYLMDMEDAVNTALAEPAPSIAEERLEDWKDSLAVWKAYPRKVNRPDFSRAWIKTTKERPHVDAIVTAIDNNLRGKWKGLETKFIPHPGTWINAHGWDDDPELATGRPWKTGSHVDYVAELVSMKAIVADNLRSLNAARVAEGKEPYA